MGRREPIQKLLKTEEGGSVLTFFVEKTVNKLFLAHKLRKDARWWSFGKAGRTVITHSRHSQKQQQPAIS